MVAVEVVDVLRVEAVGAAGQQPVAGRVGHHHRAELEPAQPARLLGHAGQEDVERLGGVDRPHDVADG